MTPDELVSRLERVTAVVESRAAVEATNAMGTVLTRHVHEILSGGSPSAPGSPPGRVTGALEESVRQVPASGGGTVATTSISPHTIYDAVQEYGREIKAKDRPGRTGDPRYPHTLFFVTDGPHFPRMVKLPPRPYMRPSAAWARAGGIQPAGQAVVDKIVREAWGG
jgi:hypothetical protein